MFAWFQRLLPRTGNFFELFEAHAATLVAAAGDLRQVMEGGNGITAHIKAIHDREHEADEVIREVLRTVRRTFLTPFDRSAITDLIVAMDDAIDEMHSAALAIELYDMAEFEDGMKRMAVMIVEAAALTAEAMPLLRDIGRNGVRLHELTEKLVTLEGLADVVHAEGLKTSFKRDGANDTLRFIVAREIYKHLERITDSFEDVANEIDGIVIDHS